MLLGNWLYHEESKNDQGFAISWKTSPLSINWLQNDSTFWAVHAHRTWREQTVTGENYGRCSQALHSCRLAGISIIISRANHTIQNSTVIKTNDYRLGWGKYDTSATPLPQLSGRTTMANFSKLSWDDVLELNHLRSEERLLTWLKLWHVAVICPLKALEALVKC